MAKKPLTPEQAEIKAMKKAMKSEIWTKFWAILLAAVLTFAVVSMGKTAAEPAIEKEKEQNPTENVDSNNTTTNGGTVTLYAIWCTCTACAAGPGANCTLSAPRGVCTYSTSCKGGYYSKNTYIKDSGCRSAV